MMCDFSPPLEPGSAGGFGKLGKVISREQVDRSSKRCALHDPPLFQGPGQVGPLEVPQPGEEADVTRRRVLRLQTSDLFQGLRQHQRGAFEQQLSSKQRPIELGLCKRGDGQAFYEDQVGADVASRSSPSVTWTSLPGVSEGVAPELVSELATGTAFKGSHQIWK